MFYNKIRGSLLALTLSMGILALGRLLFFPNLGKPNNNIFVFTEEVPLPEWRFNVVPTTKASTNETEELIVHKHYQYVKNDLLLDIEMRYLDNLYNADINSLIQRYLAIQSPGMMRQQAGIGYYGLGVHEQRAYLSACINPRGGSTFTHVQFRNNRYLNDLRFDRLIPIVLGQSPFPDRRCLWAHLSMPLKDSSPEATYQVLEKAWVPWYQWWQSRFPQP
ncbi:cyanoexosortase A system-associated protein [Nostocales cyanobacterium LEGE 11386]|nr:cyanoexosortase A system-associated protein [Nostocales cyanobacterium LEGE 11386]